MASDPVDGLRRALELTPENHALRLLLAERLAEKGSVAEAADEYRLLHEQGALQVESLLAAGRAALAAGDVALAGELADEAEAAGVVEGVGALRREIDSSLGLEGVMQVARHAGPDGTAPPVEFEATETTTFADIGGLEDVKKTIHWTIILPFQLDAIGADNEGILVLAATNAPWDVDEAIKRPGRFDRMLFVPPPDEPARQRILELLVSRRPTEDLDLKKLAGRTKLFSGADLAALVERAVDAVIDEALETGGEPPLRSERLERVLSDMRPSTLEWLATARNYVEFANQGGRYDDVRTFLVWGEARAWKG